MCIGAVASAVPRPPARPKATSPAPEGIYGACLVYITLVYREVGLNTDDHIERADAWPDSPPLATLGIAPHVVCCTLPI